LTRIDSFIKQTIKVKLIWDIYLYPSNDYKKELLTNDKISESKRNKILTECLPKFIWVCKAIDEKGTLMELIIDSTDSNIKNSFLHLVVGLDRKDDFINKFSRISEIQKDLVEYTQYVLSIGLNEKIYSQEINLDEINNEDEIDSFYFYIDSNFFELLTNEINSS